MHVSLKRNDFMVFSLDIRTEFSLVRAEPRDCPYAASRSADRARTDVSFPIAATTRADAPKIGSKAHSTTIVATNGGDQDTLRRGGTPVRPLGRLIHHDTVPVALSQIRDAAKAVFSQRLIGPKSP